ncbi:MAG: hypothetical protein ACJZ78_01755 [Prochlorococcus marinus]
MTLVLTDTTAQLGYDGDGFGGAVTYLSSDAIVPHTDYTALRSWCLFPCLNHYLLASALYYDSKDPDTGSTDDNWAVGVEGDAGPGTLGVGVGTHLWNRWDKTKYEAWYAYKINDGDNNYPYHLAAGRRRSKCRR